MMDRAAFLRSLPFLRPLSPSAWDVGACAEGGADGEGPYSGSTITPPTPSKSNAILLFEESPFVVSIEPTVGAGDAHEVHSRKRDRDDGSPDEKGATIGTAFFQSHSAGGDTAVDQPAAGDEDAMDVDADDKQTDGGARENDTKLQTNCDPSLCTFEVAIAKKLPALGDKTLTTPTKEASQEMTPRDPKALLFRFGGHFVFQVDEDSIVEVRCESGGNSSNDSVGDDDKSQPGDDEEQPPSKRQRTEGDGPSRTEKATDAKKQLPPSLVIAFESCTLRVFSLESTPEANTDQDAAADGDETRPSSRIWSTLAKKVESVENRLKKAQSVLVQQFGVDSWNGAGKTAWKMAPPGSGLAFHSWPSTFESASFHSVIPQYKATGFLEEDWAFCLGKNQAMECSSTRTTPQKSSSPSKTSGSSYEHGQEQLASKQNGSSQPESGSKNGNSGKEEKMGEPGHSSELTHEHESVNEGEQNGADGEAKESQQSGKAEDEVDDGKENDKESQLTSESEAENEGAEPQSGKAEDEVEDGKEKDKESFSQRSVTFEEGEEEKENEGAEPPSWKDKAVAKYQCFEASSAHLERAMDPANGTGTSHLTSCAESLSSSYLAANEFMDASQQCEQSIGEATSGIEDALDKLFPARGRRSSAVASDQGEDCQSQIEELMRLRKEAVATKFALLMTPKR